jgi:TetR/AcrR family transcriptional regulator, cholesterol catabolism regulator
MRTKSNDRSVGEMTLSKGEKREREIYDTAARLFARRGYSRTSIRDLSEALGLQKSSLYHYFESKEDLLHRLLDQFMEQALQRIEELCALDLPPEEKLAAFMRFYTSFYAGDLDRLSLLVNELDCLGDERRWAMVAKQRRYVAAIQGILGQMQQAGLMRDIPLPVAVFAFFGMVHYTPKWYRRQGMVSPERLGELFQDIFCHGVLKHPPDPPAGQDQGRA